MTDKDLADELLNQIFELMEMAQDKKNFKFSEELPADLDQQIARLEDDIETFIAASEQIMREGGFTEERIRDTLANPVQNVNPHSQKILEKARKLKMEVESAVRTLSAGVQMIKQKESIEGKGDQASRNVARMKKFKRVGGKKGWTPL